MKWTLWLGLAALWLASTTTATAGFWDDFTYIDYEGHRTYWIQISGGVTLQELGGDLRIGDSADTKLDIEDHLGIGEARNFWTRIDFQPLMRHHLRFTYTPLQFSGSKNLDPMDQFSVGGQGFNLGTVKSKIDLDAYDFAYRWDVMYIGERVTLSPIAQVSLLDGSAEIKHETGGVVDVDENESFFLPIPSLGLRLEGYPARRVGLFGEAKGMTIGSKGTTYDVEGGVEFFLGESLSLKARYRYAVYDIDVSGIEFKANTSGPYIGLAVRF